MASDAPTTPRKRTSASGDPPGLFRDSRTGIYGVRKTWNPGPGLKRIERTISLGTKAKAEALRAYPVALASLQMEAEGRREKPLTPAETVERWRALLATGTVDAEATYDDEIERRLGPVVDEDVDAEGFVVPVYEPKREADAVEFAGLVTGRRVTVDFFLDTFLDGKTLRYASRIRKAVRQLAEFLQARPGGNSIKDTTRRTASDFIAHLVKSEPSITTAKSKVSALSSYWDWLASRDDASENPWGGHKMPKRPGKTDVRPYTEAEMVTLLEGTTAQPMADFIRVGALTGMRRAEIGRLRVRDCAGGWFSVTRGKTENAIRRLPVHPDLAEIVARRSEGKAPEAFLFHDLPKSAGKGRERCEKMGERFTAYRREVGVDDRREDGRSRVDFHSFRRWFITEAVRHSGEPEWAVSEIVGHAIPKQSMTIETYYAGSLPETMKRIVEAVRLPSPKQPITEDDA